MSLRNVGSGIAVLHGWRVDVTDAFNPRASIEEMQSAATMIRPDPAVFRPQSRDLYSPPGDTSFWQAAIRAPDDPDRPGGAAGGRRRWPLIIHLLSRGPAV